jgi:hypothetical protein
MWLIVLSLMRVIRRIILLNGFSVLLLGLLLSLNGQHNIANSQTGTKLPIATNNTALPSATSSDEETNVKPSPSSEAQANNTLLSAARFTTAMIHSSASCDQSLWGHIYHPSRLQVNDPCITVTGTIQSIRTEKDGDLHIRLKLDPEFTNLLNDRNVAGQFGNLVVEPVCQGTVTQPDAMAACQNFHQDINVPSVGTHVTLTGAYVLDLQHGWMEIHPVTSIASS